MSIFIHDCIECQQNEHINQKIQTATIQTFSENALYFNYRISMDTKGLRVHHLIKTHIFM